MDLQEKIDQQYLNQYANNNSLQNQNFKQDQYNNNGQNQKKQLFTGLSSVKPKYHSQQTLQSRSRTLVSNLKNSNRKNQKNQTYYNNDNERKKITTFSNLEDEQNIKLLPFFDNTSIFDRMQNQQNQIYSQNQNQIFPVELIREDTKNEISQEYFGKILNKVELFNQNFSQNFLKQLSLNMHDVTLCKDSIIFCDQKQGPLDDRVFILLKGTVELLFSNNFKQWNSNIIKVGSIMNLQFLLRGQPENYRLQMLDNTDIVFFKKSNFLRILKEFPKDYERFCLVREKVALDIYEGYYCDLCEKKGHHISQCNKIAYLPYKNLILTKFIYNEKFVEKYQYRQETKRPQKLYFSALQDKFQLEISFKPPQKLSSQLFQEWDDQQQQMVPNYNQQQSIFNNSQINNYSQHQVMSSEEDFQIDQQSSVPNNINKSPKKSKSLYSIDQVSTRQRQLTQQSKSHKNEDQNNEEEISLMGYEQEDHYLQSPYQDMRMSNNSYKDTMTQGTNHSVSNYYSGLLKNVTHLTNITSQKQSTFKNNQVQQMRYQQSGVIKKQSYTSRLQTQFKNRKISHSSTLNTGSNNNYLKSVSKDNKNRNVRKVSSPSFGFQKSISGVSSKTLHTNKRRADSQHTLARNNMTELTHTQYGRQRTHSQYSQQQPQTRQRTATVGTYATNLGEDIMIREQIEQYNQFPNKTPSIQGSLQQFDSYQQQQSLANSNLEQSQSKTRLSQTNYNNPDFTVNTGNYGPSHFEDSVASERIAIQVLDINNPNKRNLQQQQDQQRRRLTQDTSSYEISDDDYREDTYDINQSEFLNTEQINYYKRKKDPKKSGKQVIFQKKKKKSIQSEYNKYATNQQTQFSQQHSQQFQTKKSISQNNQSDLLLYDYIYDGRSPNNNNNTLRRKNTYNYQSFPTTPENDQNQYNYSSTAKQLQSNTNDIQLSFLHDQELSKQMFLPDFDKAKNYVYFYPQNNLNIILQQIKSIQETFNDINYNNSTKINHTRTRISQTKKDLIERQKNTQQLLEDSINQKAPELKKKFTINGYTPFRTQIQQSPFSTNSFNSYLQVKKSSDYNLKKQIQQQQYVYKQNETFKLDS